MYNTNTTSTPQWVVGGWISIFPSSNRRIPDAERRMRTENQRIAATTAFGLFCWKTRLRDDDAQHQGALVSNATDPRGGRSRERCMPSNSSPSSEFVTAARSGQG